MSIVAFNNDAMHEIIEQDQHVVTFMRLQDRWILYENNTHDFV